jgi:phosphoribosylformylglycinamidine cyclo-ligase
LFFLDYIACGKNVPERIAEIVAGVAEGCVQAGCALIGGETAEMPGFYPEDEYDLAGFCVGMADYSSIIDGSKVAVGDALIGVASSGVHSNGFSLVRKIFGVSEKKLSVYCDDLGCTLGESLLTPTKIYVKPILKLNNSVGVHGISHITGGGYYENIPRMLPEGMKAVIERSAVPVLPIFNLIQQMGGVPERDMFNTFNMGTGLCIAVSSDKADEAVRVLNESGESAVILGRVEAGEKGVEIC